MLVDGILKIIFKFSNYHIIKLVYPWRCLKRGFFLLITNNFPLRFTILQSTLRFLIEALTFIACFFNSFLLTAFSIQLSAFSVKLFIPEYNPSPAQIVWTHLNPHFITGQNTDIVHPHFT